MITAIIQGVRRMGRTVNIVEYDPLWPDAFERESRAIRDVLWGLGIEIRHIGSTAVPSMRAKPVIDILLAVERLESLDRFNRQLGRLGYVARGEYGIPGRRFYCKGGDERTHHLHAFEFGSPEIGRHIWFRDFLRASGETATAYAELKMRLAEQYRFDPLGYSQAKSGFIERIDGLARQIEGSPLP